MRAIPQLHMLGVRVNALSLTDLLQLMQTSVERQARVIIANHNMNSVRLFHRDAVMREFYDVADYIHIDGMPLVLFGRALGLPLRRMHRVTYVDLIGPMIGQAVQCGWKVYYLGSKPGVALKGAEVLRSRFPGLIIRTHHGYFDTTPGSADCSRVLDDIREFAPNLLLVGMGMPRQERWILENLQQLHANVILPCGACIDYVAGVVPTPPRWMGRMCLEWLFRLFNEPRRLGRRYLIEPWPVFLRFIREWLGRPFSQVPTGK